MKRFQKFIPVVLRVLLGALYTFAGASFFVEMFSGGGGESHESSMPLIAAFQASGYMFPLIKGTELVAGLALLSGRFVPMALVISAPVTLNIALFHFFLTPGHDIGISIFVLAATAVLGFAYRDSFAGLFVSKAAVRCPGEAKPGQEGVAEAAPDAA